MRSGRRRAEIGRDRDKTRRSRTPTAFPNGIRPCIRVPKNTLRRGVSRPIETSVGKSCRLGEVGWSYRSIRFFGALHCRPDHSHASGQSHIRLQLQASTVTTDSETGRISDVFPSSTDSSPAAPRPAKRGLTGIVSATLGVVLSSAFYGLVWAIPWAPLQRYFLGHPVAVAATVLFWVAVSVLMGKWLTTLDQANRLTAIRDDDLRPSQRDSSPADRWLSENDAGHVARNWLSDLAQLPSATRSSLLVRRLNELLTRQSQRGTARHLADDLRELSGRDADAAHDSLGLVRIIVWAIPMLGFLGTVIGITQTLGGLDFSNGSAAVDNLKSGLYVAFDTTALGLVLSVVAIFLQFPVERSEQRLLAEIDSRVGHLVSDSLPSDEASDNQTVLIADLCKGVQAAVAESLENQAKLWRDTIDEAQNQWQSAHDLNTNRLAEAFEVTLVPALIQHSEAIAESSLAASNRLAAEREQWQATLSEAHQRLAEAGESTAEALTAHVDETFKPALLQHSEAIAESSLAASERLAAEREQWQATLSEAHQRLAETGESTAETLTAHVDKTFKPALDDHASAVDQSALVAAGRLERLVDRWEASATDHFAAVSSQQQSVTQQFQALTDAHERADAVLEVQRTLVENLQRLDETNQSIDKSIHAAAGHGMADAMRILARAVDALSAKLADPAEAAGPQSPDGNASSSRRAA